MIIYPAIDVKDGRCVRLQQGKFNEVTEYSDNPLDMALRWENEGAQYLHVVDLDGARGGKQPNIALISNIAKSVKMLLQLGGGIRNMEAVDNALLNGLSRIILGTSAVNDNAFVIDAVKKYGDRIVIGIDARDGRVAIEGWEKISSFTAIEFAKKMESIGVKTIIYTDISCDGMLKGPNLKAMSEMSEAVNINVIASGGVGKLEDITQLKKTGVCGAIVGKALYTGDVDLRQAIEIAK